METKLIKSRIYETPKKKKN